jgi:hypothetical protein
MLDSLNFQEQAHATPPTSKLSQLGSLLPEILISKNPRSFDKIDPKYHPCYVSLSLACLALFAFFSPGSIFKLQIKASMKWILQKL